MSVRLRLSWQQSRAAKFATKQAYLEHARQNPHVEVARKDSHCALCGIPCNNWNVMPSSRGFAAVCDSCVDRMPDYVPAKKQAQELS